MTNKKGEPILTQEDINEEVKQRLKKYNNLNFFERFALYMGVIQLLEFELKKLLVDKFKYKFETIEEWPMGRVYTELKKKKLRPDFLLILKNTKDNRNYITHEMVANRIVFLDVMRGKIPENHYDKESRRLDKFIIELEQLIIVFNWLNENNGWD